jgi:hypothetical protein
MKIQEDHYIRLETTPRISAAGIENLIEPAKVIFRGFCNLKYGQFWKDEKFDGTSGGFRLILEYAVGQMTLEMPKIKFDKDIHNINDLLLNRNLFLAYFREENGNLYEENLDIRGNAKKNEQ